MARRVPPFAALSLAALAGLLPVPDAPALAEEMAAGDWTAPAAENVVRILTTNEDGSTRETKIWIVQVDGAAYIRTGETGWWDNLARDPEGVLRAAGRDIPVRVELVGEAGLRERIHAAFREKYGLSDRMAGLFRFGDSHLMRLLPRQARHSSP